ncbi:hypothetical protein [Campylobacter sp. B0100352/1]|uniref:hypothetical protein n=1 Tax=Campylobacter sp. B0100352/1 TaxID=2735783 RepID=UPI00301E25CC
MSSNTEIKEQDTQDEIIFEAKKYIPIFLFYGIIHIGLLCFVLYLLPRGLNNTTNFKDFIVLSIFLFGLYVLAKEIYQAANFKRIYITKEKLVIEFYFGNELIFPLGTFFVYAYTPVYSWGDIVIQTFKGRRYNIVNLVGREIEIKHGFFARVNAIIKPHVMPYLLSLSDEEFEKIFSRVSGDFNLIDTTFLKEAQELKKEKKDE